MAFTKKKTAVSIQPFLSSLEELRIQRKFFKKEEQFLKDHVLRDLLFFLTAYLG